MRAIKIASIFALSLYSTATLAGLAFFDDFESGSLNSSEFGVTYASSTNTEVSELNKLNGKHSLRFNFSGKADGQDSFSEQRLALPQLGEIWIKFDLYVPINYYHRNQSGSANNKLLAVYRTPYTSPGFQVNWSLNPNGSGGSNLWLYRFRNGSEQGTMKPTGGIGNDFITTEDRGKWISIIARIKTPSSESSYDGAMQMWKNGILVSNETTLNNYGGTNENYINALYLLGWSNSGFSEDTTFYLDNLVITSEPIIKPSPPGQNAVN